MLALGATWLSASGIFLLAVAYFACAGAVTMDVLLKKSDVRGALGWIGSGLVLAHFGRAALLSVRHQPRDAARAEI